MKAMTTLIATIAAAVTLFAAPAAQAAEGAQAPEKVNPHAVLPFYGYDHQR